MYDEEEDDRRVILSWHVGVPLLVSGMIVTALLRTGAPVDVMIVLYGLTLFSLALMGNVVVKILIEPRDLFKPRTCFLRDGLVVSAMAAISVSLAQFSAHLASV